jgi:hypothetical protein
MAKDPTFPFYATDYLVDTLRWSRGMKSLHVDLLAESWVNGGLEDDGGHPMGLDGEDLVLWEKIKHKWVKRDGLWVNEKLEDVRVKRENFREKQREVGKKGGRPKKTVPSEEKPDTYNSGNPKITQPFYNSEPNPIEKNKAIETLLEDENEDENENENEEGGVGETLQQAKYLVPEMLSRWKQHAPDYPVDPEKDLEALQRIGKFLAKCLALPYDPMDSQTVTRILDDWEKVAAFVSEHDFFRNYSLSQVDTHSQNILQSMKNASRKTNIQNKQPGGIAIPAGPRQYGKL